MRLAVLLLLAAALTGQERKPMVVNTIVISGEFSEAEFRKLATAVWDLNTHHAGNVHYVALQSADPNLNIQESERYVLATCPKPR